MSIVNKFSKRKLRLLTSFTRVLVCVTLVIGFLLMSYRLDVLTDLLCVEEMQKSVFDKENAKLLGASDIVFEKIDKLEVEGYKPTPIVREADVVEGYIEKDYLMYVFYKDGKVVNISFAKKVSK